LSVFPSLAICQLIGGLAVGQLWSCFIALALALVFTLCATLLVSTIAQERRTVVLCSALLLLVTNPVFLLYGAVRFGPGRFALVVVGYVFLAAIFLSIAAFVLSRTWRNLDATEDQTVSARGPESRSAVLEDLPVAWMMIRRWQARTRARP